MSEQKDSATPATLRAPLPDVLRYMRTIRRGLSAIHAVAAEHKAFGGHRIVGDSLAEIEMAAEGLQQLANTTGATSSELSGLEAPATGRDESADLWAIVDDAAARLPVWVWVTPQQIGELRQLRRTPTERPAEPQGEAR